MLRKKLSLIVLALMLTLSFAFVGSVQAATEITFWTLSLSPTFDDYINGVIAAFEAENPGIKVNWQDIPHAVAEQRTLTAAAANQLPDVMNLNTNFLKKLGALGALVDMDTAAADVKDHYFPGIWKAGEVNGVTYALPWYITNSLMIYNKDLLAKAGFDGPPTTMEESWEMSRVLYNKLGVYGNIITSIHLQLPKEGVYLVSPDGKSAAINTPKALEMFRNYKKYYDEGLIPDELLLGQAKGIEWYAQERIAWFVTGPQLFRQVLDMAPDVYHKSSAAFDVLGSEEVVNVAVMNIAVASTSKNQDAAVKFAKFMTNAENQLAFSKLTAILPSVIEAANDEYFTAGKDSTDAAELGHYIAAQQLQYSTDLYAPVENVTRINRIVNDEIKRVLLEDKDPAEALRDAERLINELL
jgi:putative chitobiose transport system substrate-binding protein